MDLGTRDALLDIVCAGQAALDRGSEFGSIQIYFIAAFDCVNPSGARVGGQVHVVFVDICLTVFRVLKLMVSVVVRPI